MITPKALNILQLKKMKQKGIPISMITAYDYPSARVANLICGAIGRYAKEVKERFSPGQEHVFKANKNVVDRLYDNTQLKVGTISCDF